MIIEMDNLISFFNRSKGRWISQRTTYELSNKRMNSLQSYVTINSDKVISNPNLITSLNWGMFSREIIDNLYNQNITNQNFKIGLQFSNKFNTKKLITLCTVTDQSLISFKSRYGSTTIDETYWFATNNLRLSTSIIKKFNVCVAVSFCSEIKV